MLADETTAAMRDASFAFSSAMTGVASAPPRWSTCVSSAVGGFGFAAAHEYIKENFDTQSKDLADRMVDDLRAAFTELVAETDWMDADTQVAAQEKAGQMLQLIGYADWMTDGAEVDKYYTGAGPTDPGQHLANVVQMVGWESRKELSELREAPRRDIWLSHPAIVNAWYSPNHNSISQLIVTLSPKSG